MHILLDLNIAEYALSRISNTAEYNNPNKNLLLVNLNLNINDIIDKT